jgi:hypothetical protein
METVKKNSQTMALASILSLFAMAYIDYITGYELVFSAAYLIPTSLCAWYLSRRAIWWMSIASGIAAFCVDALSGYPYSHFMIRYWNSLMCLVISLTTGLLLHRLKRTLEEREQMNVELQGALDELKRSTEEIRKLQNGLQVVCAWTKQIKVHDQWMTPDEFLSTRLHLKVSHGMSPEASREFQDELRARGEAPVQV